MKWASKKEGEPGSRRKEATTVRQVCIIGRMLTQRLWARGQKGKPLEDPEPEGELFDFFYLG